MKSLSCKWTIVALLGFLLTAVASGQTTSPTAARVDTIVVKLTPYGFQPAKVTHSAGAFFIFVHNMSGPVPRALNFSAVSGAAAISGAATVLSHPNLSQGSHHWFQMVTLAAGSYTLTESSHPAWTCAITIQ
jgi:hypothetical protein